MDPLISLPLPEGLRVTNVRTDGEILVVEILSENSTGACPLCRHISSSIHSRYRRTLRDLPHCGRAVSLVITVRKFFCPNPECPQRIFTERLSSFAAPWAQMTYRLITSIQSIGLASSGRLGARLAHRLGIIVSWMTILRHIMAMPSPSRGDVTVVGIDDFAFRKGRTYGTILIDCERKVVLDLLPERSVDTSVAWFKHHPELRFVTRDRGQDYTQAVRLGAPWACAVADRFHLLHNLIQQCESVVARCWKELRQAQPELPQPHLPKVREWRPAQNPHDQQRRASHIAAKQEQFDHVHQLRIRGLSDHEIAQRLHLSTHHPALEVTVPLPGKPGTEKAAEPV